LQALRLPRRHAEGDAQQSSGSSGNPAGIWPHLERPRPCGTILDGGHVVAAEVDEVSDLVVGREKTLGSPRWLEALHLPFSSSRRLCTSMSSATPVWSTVRQS
jgi:hypothetical protein